MATSERGAGRSRARGATPIGPHGVPAIPRRARAPRPATRSWHGRSVEQFLAFGQRALVIGLALIVLAAFVAGTIEQRWKEAELRTRVAARTTELQAAQRRNEELKGQLAASDPDAYRAWVETTARRDLSFAYPGETVVLVNWIDPPASAPNTATTPAEAPATPAASTEPNWKRWLRLLGGG